jgi:hypothetical protein
MNVKYKIAMLVVVAGMLAVAGCSDRDNETNSNVNTNVNTNQESNTNTGTNADQSKDNNQNKEQDSNQNGDSDDAAAMAEFDAMIARDASSAELLRFISENQRKVTPENLTRMLVGLEDAQHEQSLALEERYYTEEGIQEKLMDVFTQDYTVPKSEDVKDEALSNLLADTEEAGYKPETAEGVFFPVIDYERYREFQPNVTADMKAYIEIMAVESNVAAVKDAGLVIEWQEVTERALSMESFLRDYPESARTENMQNLFNGYKFITFHGIDNAPLFSYEDDTFLPEVKAAYSEAVSRGTEGSPYLQTMKEFLELVEKNGDKQTEEVLVYQEKQTAGLLE